MVTMSSTDTVDHAVVCVTETNTPPAHPPIAHTVSRSDKEREVGISPSTDPFSDVWTASSVQTDPRRGGLLYGPYVSPGVLRGSLEGCLPSVLSACALLMRNSNSSVGSDANSSGRGSVNDSGKRLSPRSGSTTIAAVTDSSSAVADGDAVAVVEVDSTDKKDSSEGKKQCNVCVIYAISVTALYGKYKKLKSRKGKQKTHINSDMDELISVISSLSLLSTLPFSPSLFSTKNDNTSEMTSGLTIETNKKFEIIKVDKEVETIFSSVPLSQWSKLLSFLCNKVLPISKNISSISPLSSLQNSLNISESDSIVHLVRIMANLTHGFSAISVQNEKNNKISKSALREILELKSSIFSISVYLLSCLFPVLSLDTDPKSVNAVETEMNGNAYEQSVDYERNNNNNMNDNNIVFDKNNNRNNNRENIGTGNNKKNPHRNQSSSSSNKKILDLLLTGKLPTVKPPHCLNKEEVQIMRGAVSGLQPILVSASASTSASGAGAGKLGAKHLFSHLYHIQAIIIIFPLILCFLTF
jgi:hypothetical protein